MTDIKSVNDVNPQNFKRLQHERPEDAKASNVLNLEVTVDTAKAETRMLKPFSSMALNIPQFLPPEAQIVMQCFFACFEQAGSVEEGMLKDWVWGFAQGGVPPLCSFKGLHTLIDMQYVKLIDKESRLPVSIQNDAAVTVGWIQFEEKLLKMVHSDGPEKQEGIIEKNKEDLEKVGFNQVIADEDLTP